jgi:protoporphyrinogen oxidase
MKADVVLGAGVAGLAAAHYLSRSSRQAVIVLEREERVGGLASTLDWEGCRIDLGPHRIYTLLPEIERFILDLLGDEVLRVRRQSSMFLRGRYLRYPVSFGEILKTLGFACAARIGLGYAGSLLSFWKRLSRSEESYADYISSRFGGYLYRLLFQDYAIKVWQEDPSNLSADMARVRLAAPSLWASARKPASPLARARSASFSTLGAGLDAFRRKWRRPSGTMAEAFD